MIRRTVIEAFSLLFLALFIALLHHSLSSSGITIFKKRPVVTPATSSVRNHGGAAHGL